MLRPNVVLAGYAVKAEVDDDAEDDEAAWNDDFENDIYGAEREEAEAGISARDIEARMRKEKERGGMGFGEEKLDEEAAAGKIFV